MLDLHFVVLPHYIMKTITLLRIWQKQKNIDVYIYGRTRRGGYLTKKLGIFALLYVHIVDFSTTFEVF